MSELKSSAALNVR